MLEFGTSEKRRRSQSLDGLPRAEGPMTDYSKFHSSLPTSLAWAMVDERIHALYLGGSSTVAQGSENDVDIFVVVTTPGGLLESANALIEAFIAPNYPVYGPSFIHGYGLQYRYVDADKNFVDLFLNSEESFTPSEMMKGNVILRDDKGFLKNAFHKKQYAPYEERHAENLAVSLLWSYNRVLRKAEKQDHLYTQKAFLELVEICLEASYQANTFTKTRIPFYTAFKKAKLREEGLSFLGINMNVRRDFDAYCSDATEMYEKTVASVKGSQTSIGSAISRLPT